VNVGVGVVVIRFEEPDRFVESDLFQSFKACSEIRQFAGVHSHFQNRHRSAHPHRT
jgi:hypothetical protein